MKVDFYKHNLGEKEILEVTETLKSSFLTTGPKTVEFEKKLSEYTGTKYAIGLTSCTAGLFLALKALGIGADDEVIVPAMTFIATSNVVLQCGAKLIFVDVEADTGLIDVNLVKKALSSKTKAIIPVHLYGQMADMKALKALADKYSLALIEDAAHALESSRDGYKPGDLSDVVAYSFYATKNITSGEGGAATMNRQDIHDKVRLLRQHGMSKSAAERYHNNYQHWDMLDLGYKYNMFDIQAALLMPQFAQIEENLERREDISQRYEKAFSNAGIEFPVVRTGSRSARHLFTIWAELGKRDAMLKGLQEKGIGVAVNYRAVPHLTYYREKFNFKMGDFPNAEAIGDRTLTIPLYPKLSDVEVEYVIDSVVELHKNLKG